MGLPLVDGTDATEVVACTIGVLVVLVAPISSSLGAFVQCYSPPCAALAAPLVCRCWCRRGCGVELELAWV